MNKTPLFALLALLAFGLLTYLYFTPSYQGLFWLNMSSREVNTKRQSDWRKNRWVWTLTIG